MTLKEYMDASGLSQSAFAERIDRSAATVSRLLNGKQLPDWPTVWAIEEATDGAVRPNDWSRVERSEAA